MQGRKAKKNPLFKCTEKRCQFLSIVTFIGCVFALKLVLDTMHSFSAKITVISIDDMVCSGESRNSSEHRVSRYASIQLPHDTGDGFSKDAVSALASRIIMKNVGHRRPEEDWRMRPDIHMVFWAGNVKKLDCKCHLFKITHSFPIGGLTREHIEMKPGSCVDQWGGQPWYGVPVLYVRGVDMVEIESVSVKGEFTLSARIVVHENRGANEDTWDII